MNAVRVIALASAAWAFALATAIFETRPGVVIFAVGIAATASCWIIAQHVANRLKRELLAELSQEVRQL
jgi:hypothetical protein